MVSLRIDLSAHDYDLRPLALAVELLPRVTVEIPMIPEDEKRLLALLPSLESLGIAHLHLHILTANDVSTDRFANRPYTFLHQPAFQVLESEFAALRLLRHAALHHSTLPVQLCTRPYKKQSQGCGRRFRALSGVPATWLGEDAVTEMGFLRRGVPLPAPPGATKAALKLSYFDPVLTDRPSPNAGGLELTLKGGKRLFLKREVAQEFGALSAEEMEFFKALTEGKLSTPAAEEWIARVRENQESEEGPCLDEASRLELILRCERPRESLPELV